MKIVVLLKKEDYKSFFAYVIKLICNALSLITEFKSSYCLLQIRKFISEALDTQGPGQVAAMNEGIQEQKSSS